MKKYYEDNIRGDRKKFFDVVYDCGIESKSIHFLNSVEMTEVGVHIDKNWYSYDVDGQMIRLPDEVLYDKHAVIRNSTFIIERDKKTKSVQRILILKDSRTALFRITRYLNNTFLRGH